MNLSLMRNTKTNDVPDHWEIIPLGEVLDRIVGGGTPSKSKPEYWTGSIPWMTVKDMRSRRPSDSIDHITSQAVKDSATNVIPPDTVIIATRVGLGKVIRVPFETTINQDLKALVTKPELDKGYLEYWILFMANHLESIGSGTTVKGIRLERLRALPFPKVPLEEQKDIVEEIEKQFSRLDGAVTNLNRVKANLKRYKAAVLKAAVEGKLTEEWRKEHPDVEPAEELLRRILTERRRKWEETELAKMRAREKEPKCNEWKLRYKEPTAPNLDDLPNLPKTWTYVNLDQLSLVVRGASPRPAGDPKYFGGSIPWITVGDITKDKNIFLLETSSSVTEEGKAASRFIEAGTFLITNSGATLGVPKITNIAGCINDGSVAMLYLEEQIKFYLFYFLTTLTKKLRSINQGAAQPNLNTTIVRKIIVPLPSKEEQLAIISEIERYLSISREVLDIVEVNSQRTNRLCQSILKKAFSGYIR
mgnify:CR=1 FL=1